MFERILIVCVGNICRSPVAEALFQASCPTKRFASAGLAGLSGSAAAPYAIEVAKAHGIDLSAHVARRISQADMLSADLVLCMEHSHVSSLKEGYPFCAGKVFLIGHWENDKEIIDPYRRPKEAFDEMFAHLRVSVSEWVKHLA